MATTDATAAAAVVHVTRADVEDFLYAEAALLDRQEYGAWFQLFTDDAVYWVPSGFDDVDPTRHVSIVYDDVKLLSERVRRFQSGIAYAQEPQSRTARSVTNVRVLGLESGEPGGGQSLHVEATFVVVEFRRGRQATHAGRYRYRLFVDQQGAFRIRQKKVELINNAGHLGNLSVLL